MVSFILRRTLLALAVTCLTAIVIFLVIYAIPGDPVSMALGPRATPAMRALYLQKMGFDQPLPLQIWYFFGRLIRGDLGVDVWSNRSVLQIILTALPYTLLLTLTGLGWAIVLGVALGCLSVIRRGSWVDRVLSLVSVSVIAVPPFLVAIYSLLIFAVKLRWFPSMGAGDSGDLAGQANALVLPSLAVGLGWIGYLARVVRASMLEVMREKFIETARAYGLSERVIVLRYALRIAVVPAVSLIGVGFGALMSGSVFAEIIFSRPGLGRVFYDAIVTRNYPVVVGAVVVTSCLYATAMVITDCVIAGLDQRSRAAL
jgi:peptide/nickel transport system permease protein